MNLEIMSRKSLMALAEKTFPKDTAVISITDSDLPDVNLAHEPEYILRLKFDDVSDEIYEEILGRKPTPREMHKIAQRFHMFTDSQAREIAAFVLAVQGMAKTLICQCEYGQSRSAGAAAAVEEYFRGKGVNIFADVRYYPNKMVYRKLLLALKNLAGSECP